jgi:hypothetical protein
MQLTGKQIGRVVGFGVLLFIGFHTVGSMYKASQEKPKNWVATNAVVDTVGERKTTVHHIPQVTDYLTYTYKYSSTDYKGESELEIGGVTHYKQGQQVKIKVNADDPNESKLDEPYAR